MSNDSTAEAATPPPPTAHGVRRRQALPHDAALIVAEGKTAPLLRLPCDAWGLLVVAVDIVCATGETDLFAGQLLETEPDARRHDGDVVVQLIPAATAQENLVDARILVARDGAWECAETRRGPDVGWPSLIAPLVAEIMNREAVADPAAAPERTVGALHPLVSAGHLRDGEALRCRRPANGLVHEARVADGGIRFDDGRWFAQPSGALTALGYLHQNGWEYWFRARDGARLSSLRTAVGIQVAVHKPGPRGPDLATLVAAGIVQVGDELRYFRRLKGEVHTARVLADGQLQLADGSRHRTPSAAIRAACNGKISEGWRTWRRVKDDRTLLELREEYTASQEKKSP
ncbi:hypothetical protein [Amycolatopsis rubida]|uniref:RAMA domain-containing protein n=1 Tax=Amycolatopsis rubida TaxID=112413 RepID=A0A1I5E0I3_9PSEU|nr:hypothetical protein [Amycolatopsis rubida]SFO04631.1 hypothetical protein SAMN05421854_101423 [Amycolatopsis rubida]